MFQNRTDASQKLAKELAHFEDQKDTLVVGVMASGGVIAHHLADLLNLKLCLIMVSKIPAPKNSELAIGAIAEDVVILDREMIQSQNISIDYLDREVARIGQELKIRKERFEKTLKKCAFRGMRLIVVTDGMATGSTMMAALEYLKRVKTKKIIVTSPLASTEALDRFRGSVDDIVCLKKVDDLIHVSDHYHEFPPVKDEELIRLLKK